MLWLTDISGLTPWSGRSYKLVLLLDALNPVLKRYVVDRNPTLEALHITSAAGVISFEGIYVPRAEHRLAALGYERVRIEGAFSVRKSQKNLVYLGLQRFRLRDPDEPRVDLVRLASKFLPVVQREFLRTLRLAVPKLFRVPRGAAGIVMNLEYFLRLVPAYVSSLGEIRVLRILIRPGNRVHFYLQTSFLLKSLADFFGPEFLFLEELQLDRDSMEILWEQEPDA